MNIVDRRLNPKSKSLGNRQRFMRRAKADIREAVREAVKRRKVSEVEGSEKVTIRSKSVREPSFGLGRNSGVHDYVLPGNKEYSEGDVIPKPKQGGGGRGNQGSADGEGQDDFVFTLSKDEFLDIFFEDLKLPNLIKKKLKSQLSPTPVRAGFSTDGSPSRLNRVRTMRNSLARRIALRRPSEAEIEELEKELLAAEQEPSPRLDHVAELRRKIGRMRHMRRTVGFLDPIDLHYNRFERRPKPATQAVMFCLMDTSASMTEQLKDLAKRFFMLLHLFLSRHYREVDVVFIRHTTVASEVDEETFFKGQESGGTVVSTALEEMLRIVKDRYPLDDWNIYAAQASDGHNYDDDMQRTLELLDSEIMPLCQYFAYIEVAERSPSGFGGESVLWNGYEEVEPTHKNFAMRRVSSPGEIFPVFHELFSANAG
jgi:uncharacterized protein